MERLISEEERIRRAEELLERRNSDIKILGSNTVEVPSNGIIKKLFIQIIVCLCIYCGIYYIKNNQNEKLNEITGTIKSILEYDVNFKQLYEDAYTKIKNKVINVEAEGNEIVEENSNEIPKETTDNSQEENSTNSENLNVSNEDVPNESLNSENENLGIGGESDENILSEPVSYELQMKMDAEYIKQNLELINPLEIGIVTSRFGTREASNIVSGNHKGVDLGAATGSVIIAASDGKVIDASSEGDFGTHLKIQKDDVVMIYGHCSELLVNEGDSISKGQQIAKVGSTGKATGPHLHFEIRRDLRAVDPQMILDFN